MPGGPSRLRRSSLTPVARAAISSAVGNLPGKINFVFLVPSAAPALAGGVVPSVPSCDVLMRFACPASLSALVEEEGAAAVEADRFVLRIKDTFVSVGVLGTPLALPRLDGVSVASAFSSVFSSLSCAEVGRAVAGGVGRSLIVLDRCGRNFKRVGEGSADVAAVCGGDSAPAWLAGGGEPSWARFNLIFAMSRDSESTLWRRLPYQKQRSIHFHSLFSSSTIFFFFFLWLRAEKEERAKKRRAKKKNFDPEGEFENNLDDIIPTFFQ